MEGIVNHWTTAVMALAIRIGLVGAVAGSGGAQAQTFFLNAGYTFNVNSNADETDMTSGDGNCLTATGACTLRAAIQEANALGGAAIYTINLPQNVYTLRITGSNEDYSMTGDLDIRANIEINGAAMNLTRISGSGIDRVFDVRPGASLTLRRVTVQGGASPFHGGAINNEGKLLVIESQLDHNTAFASGGALSNVGIAELRKVRILSNSAQYYGGGILSAGTLRISECLIYGNSGAGGGLALQLATDIERTVIANNTGGGISVYNYAAKSDTKLTNSTITGNVPGAVYLAGSSADSFRLYSSTVSGNSSGIQVGKGVLYVRASIIDQGQKGCEVRYPGQTVSEGYNIDRGNTCGFTAQGDMTGTDPKFGPFDDVSGTFPLLPGSPAIDAIPSSLNITFPGFVPGVDQRGVARPQYAGQMPGVPPSPYLPVYDIGAFEYVPAATPFRLF
jgi:CSLREA domain-containing protein